MGTKAGTNTNLVDTEKRCDSKTVPDDEGGEQGSGEKTKVAFAVPTNLVVKNQDASLYECIAESYANGVIAAIDKWIDLHK